MRIEKMHTFFLLNRNFIIIILIFIICNSNAKNFNKLNNFSQTNQSTGISGNITDSQGLPIPGVNIKIIENNQNTSSDFDGNYFLAIKSGSYSIEASYISFQKQKITKVIVVSGKNTKLNIIMQESTNSLSEVVVTTSYKKASVSELFSIQKKAVSFTDGISAEQIKQTSDNNVAQVLRRVSGVTMQDNKFVVVRGMSERYNNVLLNGSSLPSTEPNRKNFSFDIIPSNLIDNVVVAKTFTPDMSAEFTGGTVKVKTLSVPKEKFLTISTSSAYNTQSFGKDFYSNMRYSDDYFFGTNKRDWFKNGWYDKYKTFGGFININLPPEPIDPSRFKLAAEIPNHWGLQKFSGNPSQSFAVIGGLPFKLKNENTLGFVAAINYRHDEDREDYEFNARFSEGFAKDGILSSFVTVSAGLFNMGWKNQNNKVDWSNLYNQRFTHSNTRQTEFNIEAEPFSPTSQILYEFSSIKQNTLWQTRLDGEHKLVNKKLLFSWFADINQVVREQPDDRFAGSYLGLRTADGQQIYNLIGNVQGIGNVFNNSGIYASMLTEEKKNIGGNLEFTFKLFDNNQKIKTGYWGTFRSADFKQVLLLVTGGLNNDNSQQPINAPIQQEYAPQVFAADILRLTPFSLGLGGLNNKNEDNYDGIQDVNATYIMADLSFFKNKFHVIGGMRFDNAKMRLNSVFKVIDINNSFDFRDSIITFKKATWLPSFTATYDVFSSLKFRAAYSRTLARADFRERSPVLYFDVQERFQIAGEEALNDPSISNYDFRLEWYPSASEIISISVFRKDFENPIEVLTTTSGTSDLARYVNLTDAKVQGIELNLRKHFGFLSKNLENLFLNGNLSILEGNVTLKQVTIDNKVLGGDNRRRAPNGFSPLNWNAGLTYNLENIGASINYNYIGYRIRFAGDNEFFDQYEAARGVLDLQFSFKLLKQKVEIKLNASDLIVQPVITYINASKKILLPGALKETLIALNGKEYNEGEDKILRKGLNGTTYSLSIAYKF